MTLCNDEDLEKFGWDHLTYINQFFGDETVREIITETFPNEQYELKIKEMDDFGHHHYVKEKNSDREICSVDDGYQNENIDIRDNLCQSYSLLTYFYIPIRKDKVKRQLDMVNMYKNILSNEIFMENLNNALEKIPAKNWLDERYETPLKMSKKEYFNKLDDVLDNWRDYGYLYFIGDGTCQKKTKKGGVRNTKKTSVRRTRKNNKKNVAGNPPLAQKVSQPSAPPLEATEVKPEKKAKNTVTVKIYPNNSNNNEMIIGDYRIVVDKKIPSDIDIVDHFLTNTMKYIKSHSNKIQNKVTTDEEDVFFPNTKFNYVFSPNA